MDPVLLEALLAGAVSLGASAASPHGLAWQKGDLSHLLHSGQQKIQATLKASPHQLQVVLCARGFGKTYWGASLAVAQALQKPKSKIKIGTEFQTDLESLILPNFEAVLEDCPDELRPTWKASKSKFLFPNGSEIALVGLDRKPNGLRGQHGVDLIILEEAGFISKLEQIYRSVIVPTTTHRPNCKIVLISTPPESLDHYFWTFVDRAEQEGSLSVFTIDENPMLKAQDIARIEKEMGGRETTQFQREYLCKRVAEASRMLTPEFDEAVHTLAPERDEYFQFYLKSNALDSGVRDLTTAEWAYYDWKRGVLVVEGELALGGASVLTSRIFSRSREIESELGYSKVRRHADNNNLLLIQDLNQLAREAKLESGFTIKELQDLAAMNRLPEGTIAAPEHVHWVPTRKDSVEASINLLREWLKDRRILFRPSVKHTLGTLKTALWNKQRTDFERSAVYGHADAIMSLVYLIRNVDQHTNPIPPLYGKDVANSVVFVKPQVPHNAKELARAFSIKRS